MGNFTAKVLLSLFFLVGTILGLSAQRTAFSDGFESGIFDPSKWTQSPANAPIPWSIGSEGAGTITAQSGSKYAKLFSADYQQPVKLITSMVDVSGMNDPVLEFQWAAQRFAAGVYDTLKIYYRTSETGSWSLFQGFPSGANSWKYEKLVIRSKIPVANTTFQIAFEWAYGNGKGIGLDEVRIGDDHFCQYCRDLKHSRLTHNSVTFSWSSSMYAHDHSIKISTVPIALANLPSTTANVLDSVVAVAPNHTSNTHTYVASLPDAETTYYWYVRADCGDGDVTVWYAGKPFKSKCVPQSTGIVYSFDGVPLGDFDGCWSRGFDRGGIGAPEWTVNDYSNYAASDSLPKTSSTITAHSGLHSLKLYSYYSNDNNARFSRTWAATPFFDVTDIKPYQVKFWANSISAGSKLHVGIMTDVDDISTLENVYTVPLKTGWHEYAVYLNGTTTEAKAVGFMLNGSDVSAIEVVYLDDVVVTETPPCAKPLFVEISNITDNGATVNLMGNSTNYHIAVYTSDGKDPTISNPLTGGGALYQNKAMPFVMTGLSSSTTYYVFVRSSCADNSVLANWSSVVVFKTRQTPPVMPYIEDFEGSMNWDFTNTGQTNKWFVGTATHNGGTKSLYVSNNETGLTNAYANTTSYIYAYRELNLTAGIDYEYFFDWKNNGQTNNDILRAFLVPESVPLTAGNAYGMTANTNTVPAGWIELSPVLSGKTTWQFHEGLTSVPASGIYRLTFFWKNDASSNGAPPAAIDNVYFGQLFCAKIRDLAISDIVPDGATVSWTAGGSETSWLLWCVPEGTDTIGIAPVTATAPAYTFSGLPDRTKYNIYVVSNCGTHKGKAITASFFAPQIAVSANPFDEDFEENISWVLLNANLTNQWVVGSADYNGTGSKSLYVSNDNGTTRAYTITAPAYIYAYKTLDLSSGEEYDIAFDWRTNTFGGLGQQAQASYDNMRLFVIADSIPFEAGNEITNAPPGLSSNNNTPVPDGWIDVSGGHLHSQASWVRKTGSFIVPVSGRYKLTAFWKNNNAGGTPTAAGALDNIHIAPKPCAQPLHQQAVPTDSSVNVLFDGSAGASSWDLILGPKGFDKTNPSYIPLNITTAPNAANPYIINGLTDNYEYDLYIYANCLEGGTSDTVKISFKTFKKPAPMPYNYGFEDNTENAKWVLLDNTTVSSTNNWVIGTAAEAHSKDAKGLYITKNKAGAKDYEYQSGTSHSFAYRNFALTAGLHHLSFKWKAMGVSTSDYLRVFLVPETTVITAGANNGITNSTTTPNGWIDLTNGKLNLKNDWQEFSTDEFVLENGGYYNLVFYWTNSYYSPSQKPAAIDEISFYKINCRAVNDINVSQVTSVSAYVSWSGSAESYNIKVSTVQINPETDPVGADGFYRENERNAYYELKEDPMEGTGGLAPGTTYYVYVQANCDNGYSSYYNFIPVVFTTSCLPITIPYIEHFNTYGLGTGVFPDCWRAINHPSNQDVILTLPAPYISNADASDGDAHSLRMEVWYSGSAEGGYTKEIAVLPLFTNPVTDLQISFDAKSVGQGSISVGVMVDPSDQSTFTVLRTFELTSSWQNYICALIDADDYVFACAPENPCNYLALEINGSQASFAAVVDNLAVNMASDCLPPTGVSSSNIVEDSVTISWETPYISNNIVPSYQVIITTVNVSNDFSQLDTMLLYSSPDIAANEIRNTTSIRIGGLQQSTKYYYYVRQICSNGYSSWYSTIKSFKTLPDILPLETGFEDDDDNKLWQFANYSNSPNKWYIGSATQRSGTKSLYVSDNNGSTNTYSNTTSTSYAYRTYNFAGGELYLSFDWKAVGESTSYDFDYLRVFLVPETVDLSTIQMPTTMPTGWIDLAGEVLKVQENWQHKDISTTAPNGRYKIVFAWHNDNLYVYNPPAAIDNIVLEVVTCSRPKDIVVEPYTTGTDVTWTGTAPSYQVKIFANAPNLDPDVSTPLNDTTVTQSSVSLPDILALGGAYKVFVRALCTEDDLSRWVEKEVVVDCYSEAKCRYWLYLHTTGSYGWGSNYLNIYFNDEYLGYTPFTSGSDATFYVDLCPGKIEVEYSGYTSSSYSYEVYKEDEEILNVSSVVSGNLFEYQGTTCALPCNVAKNIVVTPADVSATVAWTGNADSYTVRLFNYATNINADITAPIDNQTVTGLSATFNVALTPNTQYVVYIRGNCDNGGNPISSPWKSKTFKTTLPLSALPFFTDFESEPRDNEWAGSSNGGNNEWYIGSAASNGTGRGMYISENGGTTNEYDITSISYAYAYQLFNLSANKVYKFSFDWKAGGESTYDLLRVFLIPANVDLTTGGAFGMTSYTNITPSNWIDIGGIAATNILNSQTSWQSVNLEEIEVPNSGVYQLAFFWKNDDSWGSNPPAAVDNVRFEELACSNIKNMAANTTTTSATVTWTGESDSYTVRLYPYAVPFDIDATPIEETDTVTGNAYTFTTTLNANTRYYVAVQGNCVAGDAEFVVALFETDCETADKCLYQLDLHDNSGDGWSGDNIKVYHNGVLKGTYTVETGGSATHTFSLCPGVITFDYDIASSYTSQNSYEIYRETELIKNVALGAVTDNSFVYASFSCNLECQNPKQVIVDNNDNSATLTWTGEADSYVVRLYHYSTTLDPETDNNYIIQQPLAGNIFTYTFTGLTSDVRYIATVNGVCNVNDVDVNSPYVQKEFTTTGKLPLITQFESTSDNAKWKISINAGGVNKWTFGNHADAVKDGSRALYISSNGTNYSYNNDVTSYSYAYRGAYKFNAGIEYELSFDWKANGEGSNYSNWDVLRVFLVPASVDLSTGNPFVMTSSSNSVPSGWIALDRDTTSAYDKAMFGKTDWQKHERTFTIQNSGDYYFALFWKNDGSWGSNPPAAVDNLMLVEPEMIDMVDSVCLGYSYEKNHFNIPANELPVPDTYDLYTVYVDAAGKKVISLTLHVIEGNTNKIVQTVCYGDVVPFHGRQLAPVPGKYTYNFYTYSMANGCDSVDRLELTVNPSYEESYVLHLTEEELPATIGGRDFEFGMHSGPYNFDVNGRTDKDCDSIIHYSIYLPVVGLIYPDYQTFTIVPNPINVGGTVQVAAEFTSLQRNGLKVEIINSVGAIIQVTTPDTYPLMVSGFKVSGMYIVRVTTGTNEVYYGKVLVK
ncbi:MAG: T9SS type A sorting domain-containing protein [Prevotellaceae bacterium]|jgi:hypothetical protein|nr:T9SS type A sorting domain-containing protein [Prevotellaceae bacterium]